MQKNVRGNSARKEVLNLKQANLHYPLENLSLAHGFYSNPTPSHPQVKPKINTTLEPQP